MVDIENTLHEIAELNANKSEQQLKDIKAQRRDYCTGYKPKRLLFALSVVLLTMNNHVKQNSSGKPTQRLVLPDAYRVVEAVNTNKQL